MRRVIEADPATIGGGFAVFVTCSGESEVTKEVTSLGLASVQGGLNHLAGPQTVDLCPPISDSREKRTPSRRCRVSE